MDPPSTALCSAQGASPTALTLTSLEADSGTSALPMVLGVAFLIGLLSLLTLVRSRRAHA